MRYRCLGLAALAGLVLNAKGASADGAWYTGGSAGAVFPMDDSGEATFVNLLNRAFTGPGTNTKTYNPGEIVDLRSDTGCSRE